MSKIESYVDSPRPADKGLHLTLLRGAPALASFSPHASPKLGQGLNAVSRAVSWATSLAPKPAVTTASASSPPRPPSVSPQWVRHDSWPAVRHAYF